MRVAPQRATSSLSSVSHKSEEPIPKPQTKLERATAGKILDSERRGLPTLCAEAEREQISVLPREGKQAGDRSVSS